MIDWTDCTPLTREEFDDFICAAIPFLKGMEDKNGWDFIINDMRFNQFCDRFLIEAFELNGYYEKNCRWYYPKVQDVETIYRILIEADWTVEDEAFKKDYGICIWEVILNKVNAIADSVL